MYRNSTILPKKKICATCGRECYWFSRRRCKECATFQSVSTRMERAAEEDLQELIKLADAAFSKYIRKSGENEKNIIRCFTCDKEMDFYEAQCGHFISRSCLYLRWDTRNAKNQCNTCNCYNGGNISEYRRRLELLHPGLPEILEEERYIIYRPTKQEIKSLIVYFENKYKTLK